MSDLFLPRDLPALSTIQEQIKDYPEIDAAAIFTMNQLLQTAQVVEKQLEKGLARADLTLGRHVTMWCVAMIGGEKGITPAEIADQLGVTRATVTGLLDALERDNLLVRETHPDDRRKIIARLTKQGHAKIEEVWPVHYKRISSAMGILNDRERKQLIKLLHKVQSQAAILAL